VLIKALPALSSEAPALALPLGFLLDMTFILSFAFRHNEAPFEEESNNRRSKHQLSKTKVLLILRPAFALVNQKS
jgi:hypothetical protein